MQQRNVTNKYRNTELLTFRLLDSLSLVDQITERYGGGKKLRKSW